MSTFLRPQSEILLIHCQIQHHTHHLQCSRTSQSWSSGKGEIGFVKTVTGEKRKPFASESQPTYSTLAYSCCNTLLVQSDQFPTNQCNFFFLQSSLAWSRGDLHMTCMMFHSHVPNSSSRLFRARHINTVSATRLPERRSSRATRLKHHSWGNASIRQKDYQFFWHYTCVGTNLF